VGKLAMADVNSTKTGYQPSSLVHGPEAIKRNQSKNNEMAIEMYQCAYQYQLK